jgi:hypothetical protein
MKDSNLSKLSHLFFFLFLFFVVAICSISYLKVL